METILWVALVMTGLGIFFALILAAADHFLRVEENPLLEKVEGLLPGTNCGACGEPGCHAFAEKLLEGAVTPAKCTVSAAEALEEIAGVLGVEVGSEEKRVARLKCAGGEGLVGELAEYREINSCRAAVLVNGGGRACAWGCLGLANCRRACAFEAIQMNREGLPAVSAKACTACGDCVEVCPLDLFTIVPLSQKLFVQCNSPLSGEAARALCRVACDACGHCVADSPQRVIEMLDGLPVIHYDRQQQPSERATWRCPTGAMAWLEGDQFEEWENDPREERRSA